MMKASTFIAIMHDTCYTKQENTHPSKKNRRTHTHTYLIKSTYWNCAQSGLQNKHYTMTLLQRDRRSVDD